MKGSHEHQIHFLLADSICACLPVRLRRPYAGHDRLEAVMLRLALFSKVLDEIFGD